MGPDDGLDDLAVVAHLGHGLGLLGLHPAALHRRQDLSLLPLGDPSESHSCNKYIDVMMFLRRQLYYKFA